MLRPAAVTNFTGGSRFSDPAEAYASLALRDGDSTALGFYLDHDRVNVGDATTTVQQVFDAWLTDKRSGLDTIMLAPTRYQVAGLNHQAREHRLGDGRPGLEVVLSDGNHASVGDTIITRRNDRRLRAGKGWVKNGDRWQVNHVHHDWTIVAHDPRTQRRVTLPRQYVRDQVELGYASTIHGAQGMTVDTCHGLVTGRESRELLYTMLSRGRHANHAYVEVTGDGDPHARLSPDSITPPTPTERLEAILARSDTHASATTQLASQRDTGTLLGAAIACYQDAMVVAAERYAGPDVIRRLEAAAEATGLGLTEADAWPVLRSHLLMLHATGHDPFLALQYAARQEPGADLRDPAATIDHRLDVFGVREDPARRPLPWLPGVPTQLLSSAEWGPYLAARHTLVTRLAAEVQRHVETQCTVPAWAAELNPLPMADVIADIELWRAAHRIPDSDLRPTGPIQHHLLEARAQHRLDDLLAEESEPVLNWLTWIREAVPATAEDPGTIRVARECAKVDPAGVWLRGHLRGQTARPLPDDHKADALRFRLERWLHPVWKSGRGRNSGREPLRAVPKTTPSHSPRIGG